MTASLTPESNGLLDRIELLDEKLIDHHPDIAMEVLAASSRFQIPLGWHYILDLIWVFRELESSYLPTASPAPLKILDVGAGMGLLQFMLAESGYDVVSLDMSPRIAPERLESCFIFQDMNSSLKLRHPYLRHLDMQGRTRLTMKQLASRYRRIRNRFRSSLGRSSGRPSGATNKPIINMYSCNATTMDALEDESMDVCISISAMEHNPPTLVREVQSEISRVTKAGGLCLHTTSCQRSGNSFHEPSHSFLLDEKEIVKTYGMETYDTNWDQWDKIEASINKSKRLPKWLSSNYYCSAKNGMPWGEWKPAYMPVGIRIII